MHTLVADEDFLDFINTWKITLVLELALLRISELHQQGIPSIISRQLFKPSNFITPQPWEKTKLLKFFPFSDMQSFCIFYNGHKPRHPRTNHLSHGLFHWTMSFYIAIHHHLRHQLHHSVFVPQSPTAFRTWTWNFGRLSWWALLSSNVQKGSL